MGNPDGDATVRQIRESEVLPQKQLVDAQGVIMYLYDVLSKSDGSQAASDLLNDEMRAWINRVGYDVVEAGSDEAIEFLEDMKRKVNERLNAQGFEAELEIGTLVMHERDDTDPRRMVNVIFAVVRSQQNNEEKALLLHPVKIEDNQVSIANQHRADGGFAPSLAIIEEKYPFGYRDGFGMITSYPVVSD